MQQYPGKEGRFGWERSYLVTVLEVYTVGVDSVVRGACCLGEKLVTVRLSERFEAFKRSMAR